MVNIFAPSPSTYPVSYTHLDVYKRQPLSALFGIGFPVVLILLISMMKRSVPEMPAEMFGIAAFTPGMAVFGLSFLSLLDVYKRQPQTGVPFAVLPAMLVLAAGAGMVFLRKSKAGAR